MGITKDLNIDLSTIKIDQQKAFSITEDNLHEVLQAASTIKLGDAMSVHYFGRPKENDTNYLDTLLEEVRILDQGQSGKKLNEVVELSRQISESVQPSPLQLAISKVPVVGRFISRITIMQRRALSRFDSVKGQISILTDGIESISQGYLAENIKLEAIYNDVVDDVRQQGVHIVASKLAINSIEEELKKRQEELKKDKSNTLLAMEISGIEYQLTSLKKRRSDMITGQQKSYDDLTMLRMIQQNNLTMVDKFRSIEEMTLPAAKRGHLIVDALEKQNSGVKLSEAIDDTTNALAVRQAELVKENSIRIAKQSHRTVYDVATLDRVSKLMNETISEVKAIHKNSSEHHISLEIRAAKWQEERKKRLLEGMEK